MSNRLISNAGISVVQAIISGLILFLLYRSLIEQLGAAQVGLWSVILSSTSIARFSDMGLTGSVVKFVARYRALKDDEGAAIAIQTAAISIALVMASLSLIIYPLMGGILSLAIPAASMKMATEILPWAVISLWLGSVAGVFQSGLDGCQRMDIRNLILIISNIFFYFTTLLLVPNYGLIGMGIAQVLQSALLIFATWFFLRRQLRQLPWIPQYWSKVKFKEMFGYAVNFQINSIAVLMFDSIIKLLMSRYGGLSNVGYFEMANQCVLKLRALFIAANQALVPFVAEMNEKDPKIVRDFYIKSYCYVYFLSIPFYAGVIISLPIISYIWLGYIETQFIFFGVILSIGWGLNTLIGPAYFFNLGTGDLRWNTYSHLAIAFSSLIFGFSIGRAFGAHGVAIVAVISQIIGSVTLIVSLHLRYDILFSKLIPKKYHFLTFIILFYTIISSWLNITYGNFEDQLINGVFSIIFYFSLVCSIFYYHSDGRLLLLRFMKLFENK